MSALRRLFPSVASQVGATLVLAVGLAHVATLASFLLIVSGEEMATDPLVAAGRVAGLVEALEAGFTPVRGDGVPVVPTDVPGPGARGGDRLTDLVARMLPGEGRVFPAAPGALAPGAQGVVVVAHGRGWLVEVPSRPWWRGPFVLPALSSLAALLTGGVMLLGYAVRRLTAPLRAVAEATRGFAGDAAGPPLPETGPREVAEVAVALNAMRDRVSGLVETRSLMLVALSHDLRTPLTRLRLRAEMSRDTELGEVVTREVRRVDAMLSDALSFASPESAPPPEPIDLAGLVATACAEYVDLGRDVTYDGPRRLAATATESSLARIVANLVDNGLRHGTRVDVTLAREGDAAVLVVHDDGPGIAPENRERVFEPFHTTDASRRRTGQGFGLGLTIVRDLAKRMGGDVSLGTGPRGGLAATVVLPVLRPPASA